MKNYLLALMIGAVASSATNAAAQSATELTAPELTAAARTTIVQPESSAENDDVVTPAASDLLSSVLSPEELNRMSSGNQIAINNQAFIAENTGNTIDGDYTAGDVNFSDDAFSSFNGLGNIVVNTGAQSSLQAGMSITINVNE